MEDTTGGHWQECYELVLQQARENLTWRAGSRRLIIMVGDSSPHEPHYPLNTGNVDYRAEVMYLARDMVSSEPVLATVQSVCSGCSVCYRRY